jgi:predicted GNAT family N-acyltransferase
MHAQAHLESWYTRMGWTAVGEGFVEAEIPHRHMVRQGIRR